MPISLRVKELGFQVLLSIHSLRQAQGMSKQLSSEAQDFHGKGSGVIMLSQLHLIN